MDTQPHRSQQRVVGTQPKRFRSQQCVVGTMGPMANLTYPNICTVTLLYKIFKILSISALSILKLSILNLIKFEPYQFWNYQFWNYQFSNYQLWNYQFCTCSLYMRIWSKKYWNMFIWMQGNFNDFQEISIASGRFQFRLRSFNSFWKV